VALPCDRVATGICQDEIWSSQDKLQNRRNQQLPHKEKNPKKTQQQLTT
jgi:hypothetical protein